MQVNSPSSSAALHGPLFVIALIFLVHTILSLLGLTESVTPMIVGAFIVSNLVIFGLSVRMVPGFADWLRRQTTENLMLLHAIRAPIGAAFLVFGAHDMLPQRFADTAGWGDILAGVLVIPVVLLGLRLSAKGRGWLYLLWSVIGIVDLFLAVGTGIFLATTQVGSMDWITRLPFFLVPGFLVPWLLAFHFVVVRRLVSRAAESKPLG